MSLMATTSIAPGWRSRMAFKLWRPMRPKPLMPTRTAIGRWPPLWGGGGNSPAAARGPVAARGAPGLGGRERECASPSGPYASSNCSTCPRGRGHRCTDDRHLLDERKSERRAVGRAPAGAVVPAGGGVVVEVAAQRHVVVARARSAQTVEGRVEQAERPFPARGGPLVGQQDDRRPEWRRGASATNHMPAAGVVDAVAGQGIGVGRDVRYLAHAVAELVADARASLPT